MSWTPPQSTAILPAGTSVHTCSSTTDRFSPKYEDRDIIFGQLSDEMALFFVGPMPPQEFLDNFLPSTSLDHSNLVFKWGIFSSIKEMASEADMHNKFVSSETPLPLQIQTFFLGQNCCTMSSEFNSDQHIPHVMLPQNVSLDLGLGVGRGTTQLR